MSRAIVDLSTLDLEGVAIPEDELRSLLPHDHEFRLIDRVCHLDLEAGIAVGYKDWDDNPWWARGHIPGRPIMPGVLLAEGAAQIGSVLVKKVEGWGEETFIGLAGLDKARFRGTVIPPGRVYFVSKAGRLSGGRLARYPAQAFFDGKLVLDMEMLGAKV